MASKYGLISQIDVENPSYWNDKTFLTFDIDWAHDDVIDDTLQLLDEFQASCTLFATHSCGSLSNILIDSPHEIGIHPNFNNLLKGESNDSSYISVCSDLKDQFPAASSVRSHSLCFGSLIQTIYQQLRLTHDSSVIVPYQYNQIPLFPWKMWDNLTRIPYFFCDYVTAMNTGVDFTGLPSRSGLKVFDFHPIHVFLNTESLARYEGTRSIHHNPKELIKHRFDGYGTGSRLIDLLHLSFAL